MLYLFGILLRSKIVATRLRAMFFLEFRYFARSLRNSSSDFSLAITPSFYVRRHSDSSSSRHQCQVRLFRLFIFFISPIVMISDISLNRSSRLRYEYAFRMPSPFYHTYWYLVPWYGLNSVVRTKHVYVSPRMLLCKYVQVH
jgi:hypothetical protein